MQKDKEKRYNRKNKTWKYIHVQTRSKHSHTTKSGALEKSYHNRMTHEGTVSKDMNEDGMKL
jgi:hypothetical protein